jgi:hypothetical protein
VLRFLVTVIAGACLTAHLHAQTPQPFPRPGEAQPPRRPAEPAAPSAPPSTQAPATQPPATPPRATLPPQDATAPSDTEVYFPIYPAAQFLASYDAGRGQRYYIFGVTASFADVVTYYRTQLDERGTLVFREPPTHMFEVGRFRDETMAFPPGVTVKDWTWGGSAGYLNPKPKSQPERFPTIIMIVPPLPQTAAR